MPAGPASDRILPIMRLFFSFLALLALALVVGGVSFAILRSQHRLILLYVLFIPIWVTVLPVLVKVAWATFGGIPSGNGQ